jgi:hypothetical protein
MVAVDVDGGLVGCCAVYHFGCVNVSKEHSVSIFRAENGDTAKMLYGATTQKTTFFVRSLHWLTNHELQEFFRIAWNGLHDAT